MIVSVSPESKERAVSHTPLENAIGPPPPALQENPPHLINTDAAVTTAPPPQLAASEPYLIHSHPRWSLEESQTPWTGLAGVLALTLAAAFTAVYKRTPLLPEFLKAQLSLGQIAFLDRCMVGMWAWRAALLCAGVMLAMIAVEIFYARVYRRHFDFSAPRAVDAAAWARIRARCFAVFACLVPITFLYVYLGEYGFFEFPYKSSFFYSHFHAFFVLALPAILLLSWPYFWLLERYGRPEEINDEFLMLAGWIKKPLAQIRSGDPAQRQENAHIANLARALAVKFFFIPVMFSFCSGNWTAWENTIHLALAQIKNMHWDTLIDVSINFHAFAIPVYSFILLVDVTLGLLGYLASIRLLNTQVVTAEPTLFGWLVALLCYPPIQRGVTAIYLEYSGTSIWPRGLFVSHPTLAFLATFCSLLLMANYAWATVAFGLRFSNLTNRGLVACGPYKYVRHPAYISKNTAWWIEAIPAMMLHPEKALIFMMHLLCTNILYGLRAFTEERHLMREPLYREYCKKVPWRFIPGVF